eukprot:TRINITY_DN92271_c0_g1_i1.p1 TRINITY_DN92271_c0_g1~~TRINITY_DN92271_c0_g1_i1.p1  ORF type:complete len:456 (-),score=66.53 TRINITY_DN92271_c0_g1_i1:249-1415(-)
MSPKDIEDCSESCVAHFEQHGCCAVQGAVSSASCQRLAAFVDAELEMVQRRISQASEENRESLDEEHYGRVRDRSHRWDLKLRLVPEVREVLEELTRSLCGLLEGTVQRDAHLEELSCLITDPGAMKQSIHVDTGGWNTPCAPLLTVFLALQDTSDSMGPTLLWPGTHSDPYIMQLLRVVPEDEREQSARFGSGIAASCRAGTACLMNSRLLHCGGSNLGAEQGGSRRRLMYVTWQKHGHNNYGSTYTLRSELRGRFRVSHFDGGPAEQYVADEDRIALEKVAKGRKSDRQAKFEFAIRLREEKDPGAVEWLRAATLRGHPLACMHLAEMHCLGELGLEVDFKTADDLRRLAMDIHAYWTDSAQTDRKWENFPLAKNYPELYWKELMF